MQRTRGVYRRGKYPVMHSIHVRPPESAARATLGHRKADLIKGANNQSSVGVLVERSNRLVLLAKMEDAAAASALAGFAVKLNSIAAPMRHIPTYDPSKEIRRHIELREQTWGWGRQLREDLDAIADSMNSGPRAIHEFNTPCAVFAALLELAQ